MFKRDRALEKLEAILRAHFRDEYDLIEEVAWQIVEDIIEPAVEAERNEWLIMARAAPDRPDGRGFDS